jgi:hypothetical protein
MEPNDLGPVTVTGSDPQVSGAEGDGFACECIEQDEGARGTTRA